eukprot:GEZU01030288.1.p1 GENE.GEZU01030288.1~~GEZU01030288.1.p1  ORF type:complete len:201 (+),score=85.64 GEZU01030288.1:81-683(+)
MVKKVIIDCKGHLMGRLASVVAKQLLKGGVKIYCVRTEELNISGHHIRNKIKYHRFLAKRMNTNPRRGPFHHRSPSAIFFRTVRGMIPYKTSRGKEALDKLKCYEGIPPKFAIKKRVCVPAALRVTHLRPDRKYTILGELAADVGWKYANVVKHLEAKRKRLAAKYWKKKQASIKLLRQAKKNVQDKIAPINSELAKYGY